MFLIKIRIVSSMYPRERIRFAGVDTYQKNMKGYSAIMAMKHNVAVYAALATLVEGVVIAINEIAHPANQPYLTLVITGVTVVATWYGFRRRAKRNEFA
jgi:hypothetical protein